MEGTRPTMALRNETATEPEVKVVIFTPGNSPPVRRNTGIVGVELER